MSISCTTEPKKAHHVEPKEREIPKPTPFLSLKPLDIPYDHGPPVMIPIYDLYTFYCIV
jgi:hypothetical protein